MPPLFLLGKGLRRLVRARQRARGPLRPSWSDTYETLALVLHHYSRGAHLVPLGMQRRLLTGMFGTTNMVASTRFEKVVARTVPAEWFRRDDGDPNKVLLYLHGGGYSIGSIDSHRDLISRLCHASGFVGLAPEYRLAPEHRFPAQLHDALAAYRWLVHDRRHDPARLVVAGESAGGGLTLSLLVRLKELGEPLPAGAVCISPWIDLEARGATIAQNEPYDYVSKRVLQVYARRFVGDGDKRHPLAAPLYADLSGLPPMLVQAGGAEVLLDDARRLAERARAAGVNVELDVWDDMIHAWQIFAPIIEEGRRAIARIGDFMKRTTE